jgi:hypothetical protein
VIHANDNDDDNGDAVRGITIGVLISLLLWLLIVWGGVLCYKYCG